VTRLLAALRRATADLDELGQHWALIGGLAVSVRAEPRTTRDIDLVVAVQDDTQAERLVRNLRARGYTLLEHLEQEATGRLATVRFGVPGQEEGTVVLDLLFASSGLEPEIVGAAEVLEIAPGITLPISTTAHLLALKVLAGRLQDLADIQTLLAQATSADIQQAREAMKLIASRGFHRQKDLAADFARLLEESERG